MGDRIEPARSGADGHGGGFGDGAAEEDGARWVTGAAFFLLAVTVAWWAFALWPAGDAPAAWLQRARNVCFGVGPSGLPDAGGWLLLVGQPLGMAGVLFVGWRGELLAGFRGLARSRTGRSALAASALLVVGGVGLASWRVASAVAQPTGLTPARPEVLPRLDRPVPDVALVDQHGRTVDREWFRGGVTLVTFAFGNCETVCPVVVHSALEARAAMSGSGPAPPLVVVTVDPWRDTPYRLAHLAEQWGLGPDDRVLGGEVEAVERALDAWRVPRSRDPLDGDVVHPALVYVVDASATIAFATSGDASSLEGVVRRLRRGG